ncbi:MAG: SAM-dependent methyltransferase [Runella slithyformis]|nr:MAG: SAM-dependent methyltransferase [Runella slithyformis]TAF95150.1 MAG: SAM-dependent methyltransferase [Runella sp.]TAG20159.1 MAG: SAM-dependent methyltransferase [Cytophagales bacterium]TAG39256.1 MAG: SAM-dependent methyltransferase [Cytophagia bacterium]TAE95179.1 MAG: SAM-dependent methyltransferase [Runella slithyformis]
MKSILKKVIGQTGRKQLRAVQASARAAVYGLGNAVECPICGNTYSQFLPFNRPNALCHGCHSLERHRLVYLYLKNKTTFFNGQSLEVLHFAPEKCLHDVIRKHAAIHYQTADLMTTYIDAIGVMPDHVMSVTDIQFADNTFDVVLCNHVFELVPDDAQGMREIFRVLKPNGYAIIQAAVNNNAEKTIETSSLSAEERKKIAGAHQHVRRYGRDYRNRLTAAGFEVEVSQYVQQLDAKHYGLMPDEDIYVCWKRPKN